MQWLTEDEILDNLEDCDDSEIFSDDDLDIIRERAEAMPAKNLIANRTAIQVNLAMHAY